MVFVKHKYGSNKKKITELLRERLKLKGRVRYHLSKIEHHKIKMEEVTKVKLIQIEEELNKVLSQDI